MARLPIAERNVGTLRMALGRKSPMGQAALRGTRRAPVAATAAPLTGQASRVEQTRVSLPSALKECEHLQNGGMLYA